MRVIELVIRRFKKGRQQVVRLYVPTRRRLTRDFEDELCCKFQRLVEDNHEAFAWQDEPVSNELWDSDDWEYDVEEVDELETEM